MPNATPADCAAALLEAVPSIVRTLRQQVQDLPAPAPTFLQFRIMSYLRQNEGAPLQAVADHFELSAPTVSKAVDLLVERGNVTRVTTADDRRRVALALTPAGTAAFDDVRRHLKHRFAARFQAISSKERDAVTEGLRLVQEALQPPAVTKEA